MQRPSSFVASKAAPAPIPKSPKLHMATQQQSPLFSLLPPELRNRIYKLIFENGEHSIHLIATFGPSRGGRYTHEPDTATPLSSALLRTCQRAHQEGLGIFTANVQAYWAKNFHITLRDLRSVWFVQSALYERSMACPLVRISDLTFHLADGNLKLKLEMRKNFSPSSDDDTWHFDFTNESSFTDDRVQAEVDSTCRAVLAPWLDAAFPENHEFRAVKRDLAGVRAQLHEILRSLGECQKYCA